MKRLNESQSFGDTGAALARDGFVRPAFARREMTILEQRTVSHTGCGKQ